MSNSNLQKAKNDKYDEFYTLLSTIEEELQHYEHHFKNKVVYCNCDHPDRSMFWHYFIHNYYRLDLAEVLTTHYDPSDISFVQHFSRYFPVRDILKGNGDFRSAECQDILDKVDIIVTNPPFSLFRDFIKILFEKDKKFLVLGNMNALKYKEIFPKIKEGKLWLGVNNGTTEFLVPEKINRSNIVEREGKFYATFGNICWFTNLRHKVGSLCLTETYDPVRYQKYDTFDAIEVSKIKDIPKDYNGVMGVPITILQKHNPEQFEIVGELNHGCDNEYDFAKPVIKGKVLFPRILIKRRTDQ